VRESWSELDSRSIAPGFIYKAEFPNCEGLKWKPSIHMPKTACRLFLDVIDIRYERLQDISRENAVSEGIQHFDFAPNNKYGLNWHWGNPKSYEECFSSPQNAFGGLWASINGDDSWDLNPWVWVIEFKKVER
jgi:hypothetical protein